MLKNTFFESCFTLYEKFVGQCYGVAMDSLLRPKLFNPFMFHFEDIWLEHCPTNFKSIVCFKPIEDLLIIHGYYFDQRTTLRNLETISVNNIKTKFRKFRKMVYCLIQEERSLVKTINLWHQFTVSCYLVVFSQILKVFIKEVNVS